MINLDGTLPMFNSLQNKSQGQCFETKKAPSNRPSLIRSTRIGKLNFFVRRLRENSDYFPGIPEESRAYIGSLALKFDRGNIDYLIENSETFFKVQKIYNEYFK